MRFKGQLLIPAEGGPGLPVDLEVEGRQLSVMTDSETLGVWPLDSVRVRRLAGDMFAMKVAGEDLHFVAEDTISFAYDGISAIERNNPAGRGRGAVLRGLKGLLGWDAGSPANPTNSDTSTDSALAASGVESEANTLDLTHEIEIWDDERSERGQDLNERQDEPREWIEPSRFERSPVDSSPQLSPADSPIEAGRPSVQGSTCRALRNDGHPCESPIVGESGFCYPHDPSNPVGKSFKDAQEARARLRNKRALRLGRVYSRLDKALSQVERGEMDTDQAMAMAQLARTMCAILELDEEDDGQQDERPTPPF